MEIVWDDVKLSIYIIELLKFLIEYENKNTIKIDENDYKSILK